MKTASSASDSTGNLHLALAELRAGQVALVTSLSDSASLHASRDAGQSLLTRLRDLGFVPGARCEVVARMWMGGDPLAVRIGGSTFALRRVEAAAVRVQLVAQGVELAAPTRAGSGAVAA